MLRLRTPADAACIADEAMRRIILQRFTELAGDDDFPVDELAAFWLVEAADTVDTLETVTGLPIVHGWFSDACYPDADFAPAWEVLEAHPTCFEMLFVTSDSGSSSVLWIAKDAADPLLLAMCAQYATQAESLT